MYHMVRTTRPDMVKAISEIMPKTGDAHYRVINLLLTDSMIMDECVFYLKLIELNKYFADSPERFNSTVENIRVYYTLWNHARRIANVSSDLFYKTFDNLLKTIDYDNEELIYSLLDKHMYSNLELEYIHKTYKPLLAKPLDINLHDPIYQLKYSGIGFVLMESYYTLVLELIDYLSIGHEHNDDDVDFIHLLHELIDHISNARLKPGVLHKNRVTLVNAIKEYMVKI